MKPQSDKQKERQEIEKAMKKFKGKVRAVTKEDELWELAENDYTNFTMRCSESGILPGFQRR